MGVLSGLKRPKTGTTQEGLGAAQPPPKKKWSNLMTLCVVLVVFAEIAFLGRLDMAKNAAIVNSWTVSFYQGPPASEAVAAAEGVGLGNSESLGVVGSSEADGCEEWLEREDAVEYSRDFDKDPILVSGQAEEWDTCAVGCKFGYDPQKKPDAAFGLPEQFGTASVLRSMESASYYSENNIDQARRRGYTVVMTTSLSSDVPVGYFSWAEYDIMAPLPPKTESALAAAFISNCAARNFRLQALDALFKADFKIDSYGSCHRNRDGNVDKVQTLKRYKFSLAFENSNEEDYVTEKFFQSLVAEDSYCYTAMRLTVLGPKDVAAYLTSDNKIHLKRRKTNKPPSDLRPMGAIPVVIGAPNIQDFAPANGSVLHIKELKDVDEVAKTMQHLAANDDAFKRSVRWKYEGPSDSFKALVDMAAVHSSCRLCIHLATMIQEQEEKNRGSHKRPCKCTRGSETTFHLYVRERGRFEMVSIFLRSGNVTLEALESAVLMKFKSLKHVPIWKQERPESIRGNELKVYRIYPLGLTQRQALYSFKYKGDADFRSHLKSNPCAKFEVIFV